MRIATPIMVWKRPEIAELCYRSIRGLATEHDITISVVASPGDPYLGEHRTLAKRFGAELREHPNQPLGAKANFRIASAADSTWDYLLLLGSDDVLSPNFLDAYAHVFEQWLPAWGWADCYFHHESRMYHWPGYGPRRRESIGAGRIVRRDVLERLAWRGWDPSLSLTLDTSFRDRLRHVDVEIPFEPLPADTYLVDIKSDVSVTKFHEFEADSMREVEVPECMASLLP